jgi:hypothetical protein
MSGANGEGIDAAFLAIIQNALEKDAAATEAQSSAPPTPVKATGKKSGGFCQI